MSGQKNDTAQKFARRGEDQITPEEKIYPLRFIVDYVVEKKNRLMALEGRSLHRRHMPSCNISCLPKT